MNKFTILLATLLFTPQLGWSEATPLALTISSDKPVYEAGEKISLGVDIKNVSGAPVELLDMNFSTFGQASGLRFDVLSPSREQPQYIHPEQRKDIGYSPIILTLKSNQTLGSLIILNTWYTIDRPGRYTIKAQLVRDMKSWTGRAASLGKCYRSTLSDVPKNSPCSALSKCWEGVLTSNTITIEVKEKPVPDAIERLVERLSPTHGLWTNGLSPLIELPETATVAEVIARVFWMTGFDQGHVTSHQILETREVQVPASLPDRYTAVRVQTNFGEKIVLIQYQGEAAGWWSRVFDEDLPAAGENH
jgi:hypothetical protein